MSLENGLVRIFHLTSPYHVPYILRSGFLQPTESNVSMRKEHAGPDCLHLTRDPSPWQGWMSVLADPESKAVRDTKHPLLDLVDKGRILFELELPHADLHSWSLWMDKQGADPLWKAALVRGGEKGTSQDAWYNIERRVPWQEWVSISDNVSGQVWWRNSADQIATGQMRLSLSLIKLVGVAQPGEVRLALQPNTLERLRKALLTNDVEGAEDLKTAEALDVKLDTFDKLQAFRTHDGESDDALMNRIMDRAGEEGLIIDELKRITGEEGGIGLVGTVSHEVYQQIKDKGGIERLPTLSQASERWSEVGEARRRVLEDES